MVSGRIWENFATVSYQVLQTRVEFGVIFRENYGPLL